MSSSSSHLCNFLSFLASPIHPTPTKSQPTSLHIHGTHDHDPFPSLTSQTTTFSTGQLTSFSSSSSFQSLLLPQKSLKDYTQMGFEVMETAFPTLAFANVHWFKSGCYNVQIVVGENETEDVLLRRFKREVMKAGIIRECKRRRFFENKQAERKRKTKDAARRNRKRRPWRKIPIPDDKEGSKGKKAEAEEEDNWELPEGEVEVPYC